MMWYAMITGNAYALSMYPDEDNEKSARECLRGFLGVNRLPSGTELWKG